MANFALAAALALVNACGSVIEPLAAESPRFPPERDAPTPAVPSSPRPGEASGGHDAAPASPSTDAGDPRATVARAPGSGDGVPLDAESARRDLALAEAEFAEGRGSRETALRLSRRHYELAVFHGRDLEPKRRRYHLDRSRQAAFEALRSDPVFNPPLRSTRELDAAALARLPKEAAPVVFQLAATWARWLQGASVFAQAGDGPVVLALARRAIELDPRILHGGPMRVAGVLLARLPAALGGDAAESRRLIEEALRLDPEWPDNRLFHALYVLLEGGDRAGAIEELRALAATEIDVVDGETLRRRAARDEARERLRELAP